MRIEKATEGLGKDGTDTGSRPRPEVPIKPVLSVPLLGVVFAVGTLAYRLGLGLGRCIPVRATAGSASTHTVHPKISEASEAFNGLVDPLRAEGF